MTIWCKKVNSSNTTYFAGRQIDYEYEEFNPYGPSQTEGQNIVIVEPFSIEDDEGMYLFKGCSNATIDHLYWIDTSNCTRFDEMFSNCWNLRSVDLSSWDSHNVTRTANMFFGSSSLKEINLIGWDVSAVEICGSMFGLCQALTTIKVDEGTDWQVQMTNCYDDADMFEACSRLPGWREYGTGLEMANTNKYFTGVWTWTRTDILEKVNDNWEQINVYVKDTTWKPVEVYR